MKTEDMVKRVGSRKLIFCLILSFTFLSAYSMLDHQKNDEQQKKEVSKLESFPSFEDLPGNLIFQGKYHHRSRGKDITEPTTLWVKQKEDGSILALADYPFFNEIGLIEGNTQHRPVSLATLRGPRGQSVSSESRFKIGEDQISQIRHWGEEEFQKNYTIKNGTLFDPNTRPDPYLAANILIRRFNLKEGESKEFTMCDWGIKGQEQDTMPSYEVKVEHLGKETIKVPAGTFEANHLVQTQLTSARTWFKKRSGHITEFWVLDNNVILRILRHREPYEIELQEYSFPEKLPGQISKSSLSPQKVNQIGNLSQLKGTLWQWNGESGETILFSEDGSVENRNWTSRGLITKWNIVDNHTVVLKIEEGRRYDLYAVLIFAEGFSSFGGHNFHGGQRLIESKRME